MLLSMTGFGYASLQTDSVHLSAEIKSVNNRYLKLSVQMPETVSRFESEIEKLVRSRIARGTLNVSLRLRFLSGQGEYRIDADVLRAYRDQLQVLERDGSSAVSLTQLLALPGVVREAEFSDEELSGLWPAIERVLCGALDHLEEFRRTEGESMQRDLERQCEVIAAEVDRVVVLAPAVVTDFRDRILERVRKLLHDSAVNVNESDVIREVALFADRSDVNEEITRLRSHIEQFLKLCRSGTSQGRKLEFIGQEMFREINTLGSKSSHVPISLAVVEMKAAIERMREVLQNVE